MGGEHNCNGGSSTYIVVYTVHVVIDAKKNAAVM